MDNKKGFTLIEMIVVIVLIGVVLVIAIPNVIKLSRGQEQEKFNAQVKLLKEAADVYKIRNKGILFDETSGGTVYSVSYNQMISEGLLKNCEECTCTGKVDYERVKDNEYRYGYNIQCDIGSGESIQHFEKVVAISR